MHAREAVHIYACKHNYLLIPDLNNAMLVFTAHVQIYTLCINLASASPVLVPSPGPQHLGPGRFTQDV